MNILIETIAYLDDRLNVPVSADVPAQRPDAFVTVSRDGGGKTKVDDRATITVQVWDSDRLALETLNDAVCDALLDMPNAVNGVFKVSIETNSYYPLQVGGNFPRYVISAYVYSGR
jgi:hypothetical protein